MSLLGIQVSARGCRAVAVTPSGQVVAQGGRPLRPAPKAGAGEWDSSAVWAAVRDLLAELAAATRGDPVTAMSVAALGEALVPLTPEGQMLDRCLLGNDDRGAHYVDRVAERLAVSGSSPSPAGARAALCPARAVLAAR
jgi:sugar (pentulose or hexulose) kinase